MPASPHLLFVPRWLLLGAFPSSAVGVPTLRDGVPDEAHLLPSPGVETAGKAWQIIADNPVDLLDPRYKLGLSEQCYAYAFTYIHVDKTERVELLAGSDDGIALWVNGELVHFNDIWRGVELDNDVVPAVLRKGWNALLVKISQGNSAWGFVLRIRRSGTGPMTFSLKRAATKMTRGGDDALAVVPGVNRYAPALVDGALALQIDVSLFSDAAKRADDVVLAVTDGITPCATLPLPALSGYESLRTRVAVAVDDLCRMAAAGRVPHLEARSTLGVTRLALPAASRLSMLLDVLGGVELPADLPTAAVPALFRGAPARLEVRSRREASLAGQLVAKQPLCAARDYAPAETAAGALDLTLPLPAALRDPLATLYFGDAALRAQVARLRFLSDDLSADPQTADVAVRDGWRALAAGDLAAVAAALAAAQAALAASLPDASAAQVTLVGHAHIDMNWLWNGAETEQVTHDTFRQVLSFMDEFPDFTFSQSQASTYRIIETLDPALFARIRQRVAEGRWELLGGMVDEGDTNLSGGEAIARSLLLGQRYFQSRFAKLARVGWLPDNFGHIGQLPQLLTLAGMGAFYGHRCMPRMGPFRWEGVDGTQVLNYVTPTYNGEVTPALRAMPAQYDPRHAQLLWVYGVGDHGGGPTRRDITRARFYQTVPNFPRIRFGTAAAFFDGLAAHAADYPVHKGELQYVFEGCYTSIARIKEGNRRCENALFGAELLAAGMVAHGEAYPRALLDEAWYTVAFNQFHDILCGSAIHASNRESIAAYDLALGHAVTARYGALRALAARVPTRDDAGQPVVVFNPQPTERTDVVEAELFTYTLPPSLRSASWGGDGTPEARMAAPPITPVDVGQGPVATIALTDADGQPVDAQVVGARSFPSGYRLKVRFLAAAVPPCGWRVFYAHPDREAVPVHADLRVTGTTVETPTLLVKVDAKTGHVTRILDKRTNREVLPRGAKANALMIYMEKPHGMAAWDIGPIAETIRLDDALLVRVTEAGPVRVTIEVWRRWGQSLFVQHIYVYRNLPWVEFDVEAHWFERGGPNIDAPMLRVAFPLRVGKGTFTCETPFAALERPTTGREVPAQRWIDLAGATGGAALLNDGKYGHRCSGHTLETTLLRASYEPDPYPDQGPHTIRYALLPHEGDWCAAGVDAAGQAFNLPLLALETPPGQPGTLPAAGSLLAVAPASVQLAAVKAAEEGDALVIRLVEMHGAPATATLTLPWPIRAAVRTDLLERPLDAPAPTVTGPTLTVPLRAREIVTLRVGRG